MSRPFEVFIDDEKNPAFKYLNERYSLNCEQFSLLADLIMSAAMGTAKKYQEETSCQISKSLTHFFFDLFLCLNSKLLEGVNDDVSSAIVDGVHFRYFGQPSVDVITSVMELMSKKEDCFLNSLFKVSRQEGYPRMWASFARYSATGESLLGATESLHQGKLILELVKIVLPKLEPKVNDIVLLLKDSFNN